jgi:predicted DNA-binding transcriptional regulator YafY
MFPTQEIEAERPDGSLVVSFRVGRYEAIRNILKSWTPHIVVLSPKDLKTSLTAVVK